MSNGALASGTGTPISALRFYERNGLLEEPPRVSGQRRYPPEAAERGAMIRMWRRADFSVTEIRTLLADRHRLDDWQDLVRTKIAELGAHVEQIEQSRAELQHALFCRADDWTACDWMKAAASARGAGPATPRQRYRSRARAVALPGLGMMARSQMTGSRGWRW